MLERGTKVKSSSGSEYVITEFIRSKDFDAGNYPGLISIDYYYAYNGHGRVEIEVKYDSQKGEILGVRLV